MKTLKEVAAEIGVDWQCLADWIAKKYVSPSVSGGQGATAFFSDEDIKKISMFSMLVKSGITRGLAQKLVNNNLYFRTGNIVITITEV